MVIPRTIAFSPEAPFRPGGGSRTPWCFLGGGWSIIHIKSYVTVSTHSHRFWAFFCSFATPRFITQYSILILGGGHRGREVHTVIGLLLSFCLSALPGTMPWHSLPDFKKLWASQFLIFAVVSLEFSKFPTLNSYHGRPSVSCMVPPGFRLPPGDTPDPGWVRWCQTLKKQPGALSSAPQGKCHFHRGPAPLRIVGGCSHAGVLSLFLKTIKGILPRVANIWFPA